jgi:hypothetical protein
MDASRLRDSLNHLVALVATHGLGGAVGSRPLADLQVENAALRALVHQHCPMIDLGVLISGFEGAWRLPLGAAHSGSRTCLVS